MVPDACHKGGTSIYGETRLGEEKLRLRNSGTSRFLIFIDFLILAHDNLKKITGFLPFSWGNANDCLIEPQKCCDTTHPAVMPSHKSEDPVGHSSGDRTGPVSSSVLNTLAPTECLSDVHLGTSQKLCMFFFSDLCSKHCIVNEMAPKEKPWKFWGHLVSSFKASF